ncbi:MAG: hypothetical protein J3R72DRAFT_530172, partial [Linnemannia gamsii]
MPPRSLLHLPTTRPASSRRWASRPTKRLIFRPAHQMILTMTIPSRGSKQGSSSFQQDANYSLRVALFFCTFFLPAPVCLVVLVVALFVTHHTRCLFHHAQYVSLPSCFVAGCCHQS